MPIVARTLRFLLPAALACSGLACGLTTAQRQAVWSLSEAAVTVGSFAADMFPEMRRTVVAANTTDVRLGGHASPRDLDEGFRLAQLEPRVIAALALEDYGRLLRALVDETQQEELATAAAQFVASAKIVPGKRLSDQQYEGLGQLVEGIGGMVIDARRARAIERLVPAYAPDVEHLCDLLSQDFDPEGLHLAQRLEITLERLDSDADLSLAASDVPSVRRALAVQGVRQVMEGRALLEVVGGQGRAMVRALQRANAALEATLREETASSDDLRAVALHVKRLAAAVRLLAAYETPRQPEGAP